MDQPKPSINEGETPLEILANHLCATAEIADDFKSAQLLIDALAAGGWWITRTSVLKQIVPKSEPNLKSSTEF